MKSERIYLFHKLYRIVQVLIVGYKKLMSSSSCNQKEKYYINKRVIIRVGDRKREPFLVLALSLWYGTIFLFLEQIALSRAAQACSCCEDFERMSRGCRAGEMASEIPEIFLLFWPATQHFNVWNFAWVFSSEAAQLWAK